MTIKEIFNRDEVIELVNRAFWDGVGEGEHDYAGEMWDAESFIDKYMELNKK